MSKIANEIIPIIDEIFPYIKKINIENIWSKIINLYKYVMINGFNF